jgi:hypothetical protein
MKSASFYNFAALAFSLVVTACDANEPREEIAATADPVLGASSICDGWSADRCLDDARCEPVLEGCTNASPGAACSPAFVGCREKTAAVDPCAGLGASECLADARCEPVLEGCMNAQPGTACSPGYIGCQAK